jgi:hypothetical protein
MFVVVMAEIEPDLLRTNAPKKSPIRVHRNFVRRLRFIV